MSLKPVGAYLHVIVVSSLNTMTAVLLRPVFGEMLNS